MEKIIRRLGTLDAAKAEKVFYAFKGSSRPQRALEGFLGNPANYLLVAEAGDETAGFLVAYRLERPDRETNQLFIYEIGVAPAWRGQGLATALLEQVKTFAREEGMFEAFVLTSRKNEVARKLYKRTGGIVEDNAAVLFVYPFGRQTPISS